MSALLGTSSDVAHLEGVNSWADYSSRVQAVVDVCGPTDIAAGWPHDADPHDVPVRLLGGPVWERLELARQTNPITWIRPTVPPFLIVHAETDSTVPIDQSERLYAALQAVHADVAYLPVRGRGPGHSLEDYWEALYPLMLGFFLTRLAT